MPDEPQINLNIVDIADAVKVIDYAAEQGAYKGWANIRQVIALRDRLEMFVAAANAAEAASKAPPSPNSVLEVNSSSPVLTEAAERRRPRVRRQTA